ncbi:MAG: LCP family protein [Clostridia bacterium]|nr:LCP family protein [Clostridia bacterium]
MKRFLALLLTLVLLPLFALCEAPAEDEDLLIEEITEEVLLDEPDPGLDSENVYVDEDTGETYILSPEEQEKLDTLLEEEPEEDPGIDPDSLELNSNLPDNVLNILLIGVDTRSDDATEIIGRGDTQIIVSINRDDGSIKMTSILRDSLVVIPGYKNQTKINNAYQYGCNRVKKGTTQEKIRSGASLAMRTINRNFQMNIENYVAINFNGLASIIDALGGIDIELTKGEAWYINKYLKEHPPAYDNKARGERTPLEVAAGVQHLDGVQAVMYARTRSLKGENDFNRTDRQRHLLDLLLQKVMENIDFSTLMDLMDVAYSYSDTNMNLQTMWDLATSLLPALTGAQGDSLFEQMRVPMDGSYKYTTHNGSSVIKYNLTKHAQAIHEFVYGTYYPAK